MVEKNIYFFIGEDSVSKDRKIAAIKNEIFANIHSTLDYELFWSDSLEPNKLKEALNSLPAVSKKRIIVIKEVDKLAPANKHLLLSFAKTSPKNTLLILDTNKPEITKDDFFKEFSRFVSVFNFVSKPSLNVFDLGRAIANKKTKEALLYLWRLLKNGERQTNIVGVIAWQWKRLRSQLTKQEFERGLELLQEADFNIKRSRLKGELALELLVVKLCAPIFG
ncbi:MAG: hypothetical protein Q8O13_00635 [Candidatus Omnitrophota bacterium]|nr:hypothetical protein [Candidatus Omnitrophota bacterium]